MCLVGQKRACISAHGKPRGRRYVSIYKYLLSADYVPKDSKLVTYWFQWKKRIMLYIYSEFTRVVDIETGHLVSVVCLTSKERIYVKQSVAILATNPTEQIDHETKLIGHN